MSGAAGNLRWGGVLRLALVQSAIGAVVVLVTSTLNRIMIVELSLPALLPAMLVALHYVVQLQRLHHGYRVDVGGRCTPRILCGMALLSAGAIAAAMAVAWMPSQRAAATFLAVVAYIGVGVGVGAAGTANLTLLTKRIDASRRSLAAALVWIMMILGFGCSAGLAGHFLQPYSSPRLTQVFATVAALAFCLTWLAVRGVESRSSPSPTDAGAVYAGPARTSSRAAARARTGFAVACGQLWADARARNFTLFLFTSMFAYSAQELLLEPFAGLVFGFSPAASARLVGLQNGGVLVGMLTVIAASLAARRRSNRVAAQWMTLGTVGSAVAMGVLASIAISGRSSMLPAAAAVLGVANGTFAVGALGAMMELSATGGSGNVGLRMGLWGAAQALAFAAGGIGSGGLVDLVRARWASPAAAYTIVLAIDGLLFLVACSWALRLNGQRSPAAADQSIVETRAT